MYKPCSKFEGKFETQKAVFLCNDGLGHPGQFVYIRDDREEQEYFGLCEVEVFEYRSKSHLNNNYIPGFSTTTHPYLYLLTLSYTTFQRFMDNATSGFYEHIFLRKGLTLPLFLLKSTTITASRKSSLFCTLGLDLPK